MTAVATPGGTGHILAVHDIDFSYGARAALDGITMTAESGVITGLLGPNGAGKTTLMRLLLGVLQPSGGRLTYDARPVGAEARRLWGYMPQERGLYPAMRAGEQVVHFARLHGLGKADATRRARTLLGELGLGERWGDRTDKLSGGMQQRLQLATALAHAPEVLVLDEPFAGLDPVAVEELSIALRQRAEAGAVVLLSSHQLDLVQNLCERIVMVDRGRVVLAGDVAQLRASSGHRQLRIEVATPERAWLDDLDVTVLADDDGRLRLSVPPATDPLAVLDAARSVGPVTDFGLELPSLSQLFLAEVAA